MKALLVEDDEKTRVALTALMQRLGIAVVVRSTVSAGLDAMLHLPDVIIIDSPLQDGSGVELLHMVRESGMKSRVALLLEEDNSALDLGSPSLSSAARFAKPLEFESFGRWLCGLPRRK